MNTARILSFILLPLLTFAQAPAPYPVLVDSQRATVPALEVFQANAITFRASFKSGNVANSIVTESPFMYWQPFGATNATVVTANWSIVSGPSGVVDFAFTPADLNFAAGTYSYQVGLEQSGGPQVIKQGSFTIKPSQASIGAAPIVFATTNINWGSINWTGLPAYEYQTNTIAQVATLNASIATASNALSGQISAASNALNDRITTVSNSLFATSVSYSNALNAQIQAVNDASKWSQFQATQTVNMANNSITNAGNVQAVSINGDGAAISIPHIHGTLAGNIYIHIRNGTTNTIAKGTPVYVIGNVGAGDRKLVAPAQSGDPTKMPAIALAEANLTANADGDGVILGEIRTYNTVTNAWTVNTELYVAPLGGLTKTAPTSGLVQSVGQVSRTNSVNGIIVAQIQGAVLPKELFLASTTTFVAVESDPIFAAVSNSINTRITAVETGKVNLSVYTPATQALWTAIGNIVSADNALTNVTASGRIAAVKTGAQVALTFDASGLATGTPIYSVDGKLDSNTWAAADSTTNYASRITFNATSNSFNTRITDVEGYTNRAASALASSVWASADSTTNYASRIQFIGGSNSLNTRVTALEGSIATTGTVASLETNIAARLASNVWASADSTTNYASRIDFVSVSNTVTALGTNVAARLASNVWAAADSTTNYAPRTSFVSVSNTVVALGTNVAARLASNVWAAADSTTNYALRTTFVTATNSLQTDINTRLASNTWAAADSTTNYASRITFNATSNALNNSITSLAARAFVYTTNLSTIAGSGLGVVSNQLAVTDPFSGFTTNPIISSIEFNDFSRTNIFINRFWPNAFFGGVKNASYTLTNSSGIVGLGGFDGRSVIVSNSYGGIISGAFFESGSAIAISGNGNNISGAPFGPATLRINGNANMMLIGDTGFGGTINGDANILLNSSAFGVNDVEPRIDGTESISLGPNIITNSRAIVVGMSRQSVADNSVLASSFWGESFNGGTFTGSAASLTNFPTSLLTVTAGNANYWRITTAPTGATSSGSSGQMAVSGTNLYIYSPNALGVGTARWLRVSGDVSW